MPLFFCKYGGLSSRGQASSSSSQTWFRRLLSFFFSLAVQLDRRLPLSDSVSVSVSSGSLELVDLHRSLLLELLLLDELSFPLFFFCRPSVAFLLRFC
jgi:hypothetical protein